MSDDKPSLSVDLELATTGQIMAELANRNKSFIMIYEPGSGVTNKENALECHVAKMNPQKTFELLAESAMMMEKVLSGEINPEDCSIQFMELQEDGDYKVVEVTPQKLLEDMTEEEQGYDPWGAEVEEDEEDEEDKKDD